MSYVLGIDLGTSSVKGLVLDQSGTVITQATEKYPLIHLKKGYSEQRPNDWIEGTKKVIQSLIRQLPELETKLEGVSFSGQMHSLVLLDEKGRPIRDAILWNDVRTTEQCQKITQILGSRLVEKTKNLALEGFTLPKIIWVQENEPETWQAASTILLPKDYLAYWLTGNQHMEFSDAAGTLLLNVEEKRWDSEIAETFGISKKVLPSLVHSSDSVGFIQSEICQDLGLKGRIEVFAGGADNACAALGAGIIDDNRALCSIGTSGVFLSYEGENVQNYEGKLHFFNHVIDDSYYSMGVTLAAGQSLKWFKDIFGNKTSYEKMIADVENSDVGSNGLIFTPYIMGERTPYVDSQIRGSFIGMDANHTFSDFTRAVLEGITFSLKDSQSLMESIAGKTFDEIISVGGGAKSAVWLQMQADIFNTKIRTLKVEQGPGLGAAMIAAMGVHWFDSIEECVKVFVRYENEFLPNPKNVRLYDHVYAIYTKVYENTRAICQQLSERNC